MEQDNELADRVARLEAEVARLNRELAELAASLPTPLPGREGAPAAIRPQAPSPAPRPASPPAPRRTEGVPPPARRASMPTFNPVVLVAAAGALIFLAGAAYFLLLAIQHGWLGPEARFLMGLLAGAGLGILAGRTCLRGSTGLGVCLLAAGLGTLLFSFYNGAFGYHFYPAPLGLAGTAMVTLVAGGLAAKVRSGAALAVALLVGLAAPLVFSEGGHHEVALACYLAALQGAAIAVPYLAGAGARWSVPRGVATAGVWILLGFAAWQVRAEDGALFLGCLGLHVLLTGIWTWLPGLGERPGIPTLLWTGATLAATGQARGVWRTLGLMPEAFALPLFLVAAANLALVKPLRARLGDASADLGLLALAGAHMALLVPVALAWDWVGTVWGLYALALAWAAGRAGQAGRGAGEVRALVLLGWAMALLASLRWAWRLDGVFFGWPGSLLDSTPAASWRALPLLDRWFVEGILASAAWALLLRRGGKAAAGAFIALQAVANVTLGVELGRLVYHLSGSLQALRLTGTLMLACSGASQWVAGLGAAGRRARALAGAGYFWLAVASCKLLLEDLAGAATPVRALALLGVGGIFLAAALIGNRHRRSGGGAA